MRCGKCDVCHGRNELSLSQLEFDQISSQVKELLKEPFALEELLFRVKASEDDKIKVVRWLMDNNKIIYRVDNKLEWVSGKSE